jgi:hypothetical protein
MGFCGKTPVTSMACGFAGKQKTAMDRRGGSWRGFESGPPECRSAQGTIGSTTPLESGRIASAGIVSVFSSTDPIREDAAFLLNSNGEYADEILFVRQRRSNRSGKHDR